mmetsp:Transcript_2234/g.3088  ORF Transcript_2234/g.3088 Transcript_2234/m.3088 type:complete len:159 (-) Transcript_2234:48-524(-)|eukprot:CAMPEP_0198146336 /NCGR_PEP_ID=MMETSP1443-20131203/28966_1 /TAXON_ID=186043 /ORGANISM="Entomoneis sp., Strain CCMP2396" /LENGTH=158 /DNA_ID=CAMNT_0043810269 /DNA_START=139 /DNA_END=615 /DNA_ORIENTATION=+
MSILSLLSVPEGAVLNVVTDNAKSHGRTVQRLRICPGGRGVGRAYSDDGPSLLPHRPHRRRSSDDGQQQNRHREQPHCRWDSVYSSPSGKKRRSSLKSDQPPTPKSRPITVLNSMKQPSSSTSHIENIAKKLSTEGGEESDVVSILTRALGSIKSSGK